VSSERQFVPVPEELLESIDGKPTWSDVVRVGQHVYATGQVGWDKTTGRMVDGGIEAQTRQAMHNLQDALARVHASLSDVVIVRVYLVHKDDHDRYDPVYHEYFPNNPPARVTVVVADLIDDGCLIDIEAEAVVTGDGRS
jgi:2-iminobutanoate/2-iminopropanoate deaminase